MIKYFLGVLVVAGLFIPSVSLKAHCEIPCGIYGDSLRFEFLKEDIRTIEKSMKKIEKLSGEADKNYNQLVRWIDNKEEHAEKFMVIISQYFMTQRIKLVEPSDSTNFETYLNKLSLLHQMLVYAMKCKQNIDKTYTVKLISLVEEFELLYFNHRH
ncbi:MAG: superoxide dismutase [Ni] [Candidatus Zixiibacteriota bacterium]